MKIFTTKQIAAIDKYTIENEPIADIDLMERASLQITNWIVQQFTTEERLLFFAGPGNNGGDALAIARQLAELSYQCEVYLLDFGKALKGSPEINFNRLEEQGKVKLVKLRSEADFPHVDDTDVLIDGLFGSGLSRPLEGLPAQLVQKINQLLNVVVAVDIPSGLMGEDNSKNNLENIIRADYTLTLQFPKISFLFPENEQFVGQWEVLSIGLHPDGIWETPSPYALADAEEITTRLPVRSKFDHKGTFGHALLIAGSYGKMGAAVLASKACMRAGAGLLTTHVPHMGFPIIQTAVPEAMASIDQHDSMFTTLPDLVPYAAIGIGPGMGKKHNSCRALCNLLEQAKVPLVIDADALNILAENKAWLEKLPEGSVLTPHPGEFSRLVGETTDSYDAVQKQMAFAQKYNCVVVLKGAHTSVAAPNGRLSWNSTGNSGMGTAGSGDVLTGIILGLLVQGMAPVDAALAGVYLHGLAGDIAAKKRSEFSLMAGDIIDYLGKAFLEMQKRD
ncbi:NAD(P)H-hydrate dehydratase [Draconibacterium halophilum]|uniref:Bifunctional NAD(P)H-hydrate repair enzyme n=1 Tax=Draconibacterium halophilum TaxID=2706887 RepID=A0A6C0RBS3_9BACT|nr:NAD(P)H-hydrate dehydratase [Draconibacterium halophilum]QIA07215.1 NAD(P)H-hydrate dehydratase [Draconibacterium halophilum]